MRSSVKNKKAAKTPLVERTATIETGSGNVFADLGIAQPEKALVKAKLVQQIRDLITHKGLTQTNAANLLGLDQPKVSALVRGRTSGFTIDRLFKFLNLLSQKIEISIRPVSDDSTESLIVVVD